MKLYEPENVYIVWDLELDMSRVLTDESSLKSLYEDPNSETKYEKVTVKDYMKYVGLYVVKPSWTKLALI